MLLNKINCRQVLFDILCSLNIMNFYNSEGQIISCRARRTVLDIKNTPILQFAPPPSKKNTQVALVSTNGTL